ncbi:MAG: PAS domain S-box protein [Desulfocapsa sp.]|nr:PAS domain S-box protein [Desulfocapsa sp.]
MKKTTLHASSEKQARSTRHSPFSQEQHHVNCINSLAVIQYVEEHVPSQLPALFEDLIPDIEEMEGMQDVKLFLTDPNNWIPSSLMIHLFKNAKIILNDADAPFHIGYNSVLKKRYGYIQKIFIYSLGNPSQGIKKLQKLNNHFNRTKTVEIVSLTRVSATIRLHWDKNIPLHVDFCHYNKGIYQAIPTIWGHSPAEITETKDFFDGDDYCEYHIKWKKPGKIKDFFFKLFTPGKVIQETIHELELDKELLKEKYHKINTLNRRLERKVTEMTTLQESSTAILSTLNLEDLLDVIVSKLMDVADLDRACIFLANKKSSSLILIHAMGIDKELITQFKGYEIPLNKVDNIIARTAHNEDPIFVENVDILSLNPDNVLLKTLNPKAFILVPLNVRGKIIGIMLGDNHKNQDFVHRTDKHFLKSFANHIAMALDNANLYKKLRTSEERYREIVENVNEGIWILDVEGNVQFANRRLLNMLGHDNLTGVNIARLVRKDDEDLLQDSIDANLNGNSSKMEVQLKSVTGGHKTVLISSVPLKHEDSFSGCLAIVTDLTDKKVMEKKLLQTQKLESIGTMAGGIAHDFNNILTGVLGYTAMLQLGLADNPKMREYADIIETSSLKASHLIQKMLAFSRHSKPADNAATFITPVIEDALSLIKSSLPKTIKVVFNRSATLPRIKCDQTELQQIILNLCINARDAMPEGGFISISTKYIPLKEVIQLQAELTINSGDYILLTIADTGTGMSEEVQDRMFDPFYTTKEVGKGSGLGLAMVYGIIQSIGGAIQVESKHGEGAAFKLYFPLATENGTLHNEFFVRQKKGSAGRIHKPL